MNTIGVLARPDLKEASAVLAELTSWLRARGVRACLEEKTAALAGSGPAASCLVASGRDVAGLADALVVLGGDGTLLAASRLLEKE
ncbi:MAG: NAD(+)/NADH kinase, partial [Burkholderiales bacterium]